MCSTCQTAAAAHAMMRSGRNPHGPETPRPSGRIHDAQIPLTTYFVTRLVDEFRIADQVRLCGVSGRQQDADGCHRDGKARWWGTEFFVRYRPYFPLSGIRRDEWSAGSRSFRIFHPVGPETHPSARRPHRRRFCLSRRHAPQAFWRLRASGHKLCCVGGLSAAAWP